MRPTGEWPNPDGSLLVADEFGKRRLPDRAGDSRTALVRNLPIVDDVAQATQGAVFLVTPADVWQS